MASIAIKTIEGKEAGSLELKDSVFGIELNEQCVRIAVNQHLSNRRAGTHSTRGRSRLRGGGRKPWRQKGTGRARQGSTRAVQWRGGAIAFGPRPRKYGYSVNRKVKRLAVQSALTDLARSQRLIAIEDFTLEEPKTGRLAAILGSLGLKGSTLLIIKDSDRNIVLSARNMRSLDCMDADSTNVFDLLSHDNVVATKSALAHIEQVYA
ncbi:50S ribosomal protein L4 [Candidatus Sumerlaeota bacterium]|nr:50S ribosomal protein L4 [Candidatus Sumerlaeota bacterium]